MKRRHRRDYSKTLKIAGIAVCIIIGIAVGVVWFYRDGLPPTSELRNFTLRSGSEVYDRNGKMIHLFAFEKRKLVSLRELPPHLVDALIVAEDKNFYKHCGVDILGNVRAILIDIVRWDFSQGASTITQQMARNMFLTLDKRISRKIKEILLSFRIEREFTKDEILEIYFNKIFWGGQIHGVETAALYYFGKHAKDLSLPESATLVGMIQRPNYFDPIKHPDRALARRNLILERMKKARKLDEEEYLAAIESPLRNAGSSYRQYASDYFIEHIRLYLERKYGTERLFEGGLRIYTTLDQDLSVYADSVLNQYLTEVEGRHNYSNKYASVSPNAFDINTKYLQGGLVLMENKTGYVRALIGGRNFTHSKFNRMTQE
ncbi:MAG TPA: transglycosylase domain-containing protein, partial [Candidatus Cloacimonadota bacterium]|nr:transglycosylase domain-containing protein [Candidatus Cloacimonadota bacterium]